MTIDHVAIWTDRLEELKDFYCRYFGGTSNEKYKNPKTLFESYFVNFGSGATLEIMCMPGIPENANDTIAQYKGITHLSFHADTMAEVDRKADELRQAGCEILRGPRVTGDGGYEFETLDLDGNRLEVTTRFVE